MNYEQFVKKIEVPADFIAPTELRYEDLIATPLTREHLQDDMAAVNSSLVTIRQTRGGSWPSEPVSEEFDLLDLAWHEREFRDGNSYAYVVYNEAEVYIGCFYLYGMGHRTTLTEELSDYQVDASWWVTEDAYGQGYYQKLQSALQGWLQEELGFSEVYYSNKEQ